MNDSTTREKDSTAKYREYSSKNYSKRERERKREGERKRERKRVLGQYLSSCETIFAGKLNFKQTFSANFTS